ncbi:8-amino-7-oxononanoate synthase [Candidatus Protofrankia californiensis]|uniref:8-amino-7-oxononanoate synthase n=1 Tax=Candidatus Protofrankia californiensis TaxID=1839754 RepID=UPI0010414852|nr:8-amino-7-oxononanoate synthase [Candidatus Protofrankia californiensis]
MHPRTTDVVGNPLGWLDSHARRREEAGLRRVVRPRTPDGRTPGNPPHEDPAHPLDLASNDYLGLSRHPEVIEGGVRALRTWGAGSTGSRLVTGTTTLHGDLENALAHHTGFASALVFASGYAANLGVLTALTGPDDLIVSDERNHASLVDACRLSRARVLVIPHADVEAVDSALAERSWQHAVVVTDSVFSADGDLAPLAALHAVTRAHGALLVVDEAHSLGVVGPGGRGALADVGLAGEPDVIATVTLSKALGSQGGAVLGPPAVRAHLIDTARTFIFDTGLAPACAGTALAAVEILTSTPDLAADVRRHARRLAALTGAPRPAGAVVSVVLGEPERAVRAAEICRAHGVAVGCFRPPTVPPGTSRLRVAARADLTETDLAQAAAAFAAALGTPPPGVPGPPGTPR